MGLIKQFTQSITKFSAYPGFIKQTTGRVFLYFFMFSLVFGIIWLLRPTIEFNSGISDLTNELISEMPDFTLANGELEVHAQMPIIKKDRDQIFVIDTTGQTSETVLKDYPQGVFISKYKMVNKKSMIETQVTDFKELKELTFTKNDLIGWMPLLKWVSVFIIFFGLIYFILAKLFTALVISLIGLIFNSIQKTGLTFGALFKITIYVLTLPVVLQVLSEALIKDGIPYFGLLYYLLIGVYLWFAIAAVKKDSLRPVEEVPGETGF